MKKYKIAKIEYQKVLKGDAKKIRVLRVRNAAREDELPEAYLKGSPRFFGFRNGVVVIDGETRYRVAAGAVLPKYDFERIVALMKEAGHRLGEIIKWDGTKVLSI